MAAVMAMATTTATVKEMTAVVETVVATINLKRQGKWQQQRQWQKKQRQRQKW